MTEYIVLGRYEILDLKANRPVSVDINGESYTLCTNEYFEKQKGIPPCGRCRYHDDYTDKSIRPAYCATMCANNWSGFREK